MGRQMMAKVVAASAVVALAAITQAGPIAYEGFDYPNESAAIAGRSGGSGWAGGWINANNDFNHLTQDDASLDSRAFPFTPTGDRVAGSGGAARRVLGIPFNLSQDDAIYVSFLLRKEDTGDGSARNVELALTTTNGSTQIARLGSTSSHRFFLTSTTEANLGNVVAFGETYFLVLKGVSVATGTDQFFAKLYDTNESPPTTEPLTWDLTFNVPAAQASLVLSEIRLAIGANASGALDEIRVGKTFADVAIVPELASSVLLAIGGVGLACANRRRRHPIDFVIEVAKTPLRMVCSCLTS